MATFRVGQRVRIRPYNSWPAAEGTIEAIVSNNTDQPHCAAVLVDGHPTPPWSQYRTWSIPRHILEPIQHEGNKVIDWSECLWMPEHMRETA